jgi:hypothetical protein
MHTQENEFEYIFANFFHESLANNNLFCTQHLGYLPKLKLMQMSLQVGTISSFLLRHRQTLISAELEEIYNTHGSWRTVLKVAMDHLMPDRFIIVYAFDQDGNLR